jgi:6-pyruvoyltetrahydropterin/6-carboxytetrahydropterin synthase
MHKLERQVRFSINPFLEDKISGRNSYCSKPAGEGLALFFELSVQLSGKVNSETGFIINVERIDKYVRKEIIEVFEESISNKFKQQKHISLFDLADILKSSFGILKTISPEANLSRLALKLNPNRSIFIYSEEYKMLYLSENFEFAATHKLWNDRFSEEENISQFGKCANPTGHGHNYVLEVTVAIPSGKSNFSNAEFESIVENEFINCIDHKNINLDLDEFKNKIPSVENLATFAWSKLKGKFGDCRLHCVKISETDRTHCSYCE